MNSSQPEGAALVLFSGGQDSATCLAWALDRYARVETIAFDYGQRHHVELTVRRAFLERLRAAFPGWAPRLGEDHLIDLAVLGQVSETALTREVEIRQAESGLPTTFVPGRNLLFLTFAAAVGHRRGIDVLVGGMCETDYSGYPDCRAGTMRAMQEALTLGMDRPIAIATPLMHLDKAETWALAQALGGAPLIELIRENTHTCYLGERGIRHDWGYGCGTCPACALRQRGHERWVASSAERAGVA